MFAPKTWLSLFSSMGFLHENITFAYFYFYGRPVVISALPVGFFRTFGFSLGTGGLF